LNQNEFQPSTTLKKPYILAGVNIIVADTDEEAERISTSLYKTVMGIISGKSGSMEAPVEMTDNIRELKKNPAVNQVLKYSFIGSKETVKNEIKVFMSNITVDELIAVTNIFDKDDRLKSYRLFSEIMRELNGDTPIP
jgi:alkanesulfonate monooxygenase SsuD/methylene tetrahydromethanopterin reductase-like flavin-dependent oxidoreductase (luciferase family)